jgi:class 3 adenylate cyclase/tetratricopeptide (TPR) repeat protein
LHPLREQLAANAHEVWSAARVAQGWTWGPVRDDALKQHPCLVPYDELPESEKLIDRNAVAGALAAIMHFGWRLQPPVGTPGSFKIPTEAAALRCAWDARADDEQNPYPMDDYRKVAVCALRQGELLLASDAARAGLRHYSDDLRLAFLAGRALAEMRRPAAARALMEAFIAKGHDDSDALGLLARTYKDEGFVRLAAGRPAQEAWNRAADIYGDAFGRHRTYFNGINAATMAFFAGEDATAGQLAAEATALARLELETQPGSHWARATLGEAALLGQLWDEAGSHYRQAVSLAGPRSTDRVSMSRQAHRVVDEWIRRGGLSGGEPAWIEEFFPRHNVAVFSGHRFDRPDRENPRLRETDAETVQGQIATWLTRERPQAVFSSLSIGADLLFAESALAQEIPVHLVLATGPEEIRRLEGESFAHWHRRFDRVCAEAASVTILGTGQCPLTPVAFAHCNEVFTGLAWLKADSLDVNVCGLAVWDGRPGDGPGGTADCVEEWRAQGMPVEVIAPARTSTAAANPKPAQEPDLVVRAMLFADVKGFSKLSEAELFVFGRRFMESLASLLEKGPARHEMVNTWGDGVFVVFRDVVAAGRFALALRDLVKNENWTALGLSQGLGIRIGLHAGPVMEVAEDPVLKHPQYYGCHINRAARIEPITEVGQVYASDSFAALARLKPDTDFSFDYVGSIPLAKSFGKQRLFRVDYAARSEQGSSIAFLYGPQLLSRPS